MILSLIIEFFKSYLNKNSAYSKNTLEKSEYFLIDNIYQIKPILLISFKNLLYMLRDQSIGDILFNQCKKIGLNISEEEKKSWYDYQFKLIELFKAANLHPECLIGFEWVQKDFSRIDLTLFGMDNNGNDHITLVELKSWTNQGDNIYELLQLKGIIHPIVQANKYYNKIHFLLKENNLIKNIKLESVIYMFNYRKFYDFSLSKNDYYLFANKNLSLQEKENISNFLFTIEDKEKLIKIINKNFANGKGFQVYNKLNLSEIKNNRRISLINSINYKNDLNYSKNITLRDYTERIDTSIPINNLISVSKIINFYLNINYSGEIKIKSKISYFQICHKIIELYFKNINRNIDIEIFIKEKIFLKYNNYISNYYNTTLEFLIKNYNKNLKNKYYVNNPEKYLLDDEKRYSSKLKNDTTIYYEFVSARPNLIIKDLNNVYSIIIFKTNHKELNEDVLIRVKLQLVAYYWILSSLKYNVSNIVKIYWIQQFKVEEIQLKITSDLLNKWKEILHFFKINN